MKPKKPTYDELAKAVRKPRPGEHCKVCGHQRYKDDRPSVKRLCKCGHSYADHGQFPNCQHEVGGQCVRHLCTQGCSKCKRCKEFRERPARLAPKRGNSKGVGR